MRLSTRPEGFHKLAELQRLCSFSTAATRSLVVRNIKLSIAVFLRCCNFRSFGVKDTLFDRLGLAPTPSPRRVFFAFVHTKTLFATFNNFDFLLAQPERTAAAAATLTMVRYQSQSTVFTVTYR